MQKLITGLTIRILLFIVLFVVSINAQTTSFTYQGNLIDGSVSANGDYDFEFTLYNALSGGSQIGSTLARTNIPLVEGVFSVSLDFGDEFPGAGRWLEIRVKQSTSATVGGFTTLAPRQAVSSSPYSIKSLTAENANTANSSTIAANATQLGGVDSSQYVLTGDSRLSDSRTPTAGSPDYIQNSTSQQTSSNFNISGTGTAEKFDAITQYNIGGNRVLSVAGQNNLFVGIDSGVANTTGNSNSFFGLNAGASNTSGGSNSFFGRNAGLNNTDGNWNSFFGREAGASNTTGSSNSYFGREAGTANATGSFNSFFGRDAGQDNTTGNSNSFFGANSGRNNTTGINNSFFGSLAGGENTTGKLNSFFGKDAGRENTTGNWNAFFGANAGQENTAGITNSFFGNGAGKATTTGNSNSFFGERAGNNNVTGSKNTLVGIIADLGSDNLDNATAIGAFAQVDASNSMVLGSINGVNFADADTNVGIGTTAPTERLHIAVNSGRILMGDAGCSTGVTAIGFASTLANCENYAIAGTSTSTYVNAPTGGKLYFRQGNTSQMIMSQDGTLVLNNLGSSGSTSLCRNASNEISTCSSSVRYKSNIEDFRSGLDLIGRLRPVSFNWKEGGMLDVGLVAEEVAEVEPLLTTTKDGRVEGVKYDRIGVVLINAVQEQQERIARQENRQSEKLQALNEQLNAQKKMIASQQAEIDALKQIVCSQNREANICKSSKQEK